MTEAVETTSSKGATSSSGLGWEEGRNLCLFLFDLKRSGCLLGPRLRNASCALRQKRAVPASVFDVRGFQIHQTIIVSETAADKISPAYLLLIGWQSDEFILTTISKHLPARVSSVVNNHSPYNLLGSLISTSLCHCDTEKLQAWLPMHRGWCFRAGVKDSLE